MMDHAHFTPEQEARIREIVADAVAGAMAFSIEVVGVRPPAIFTTGEPDEGRNLTGGGL